MSDLEVIENLEGKKIFKFTGERKKPKPYPTEKKGGLSRYEQEDGA